MARPRQPDIEDRLLAAWDDLSHERAYRAITMEAVAARAGVGKPSLYRRFPTKAHLAFAAAIAASAPAEPVDHGSLRADLRAALDVLVASLHAVPREVYADQIATAIADEGFAHAVAEAQAGPALDRVAPLWDRALARAEVDPGIDGRAVLDELAGALIFHVLVRHREADAAHLDDVVRRFVRSVAPPDAST